MGKTCVQVEHVVTKDRANRYLASLESPVVDSKELLIRYQHNPTSSHLTDFVVCAKKAFTIYHLHIT